jgi:hypothetical protein
LRADVARAGLAEDLDFAGDFRDFDAALAMASSRGREENGRRVTPRMDAPTQVTQGPILALQKKFSGWFYLIIPRPMMPMKIR